MKSWFCPLVHYPKSTHQRLSITLCPSQLCLIYICMDPSIYWVWLVTRAQLHQKHRVHTFINHSTQTNAVFESTNAPKDQQSKKHNLYLVEQLSKGIPAYNRCTSEDSQIKQMIYFHTCIQLLISEGEDDIFCNGKGQHKAESTRSPQKYMFKHTAAFQERILHGNDHAHSDNSGSVSSPTVGSMTLFSPIICWWLTNHDLSIGLQKWTDVRPFCPFYDHFNAFAKRWWSFTAFFYLFL